MYSPALARFTTSKSGFVCHGMYKLGRRLVKVSVDVLDVLGVLGGDAPVKLKGTTYNHVIGEVGDGKHKELRRHPGLELVRIYYCQAGLGLVEKSVQGSKRLSNRNRSAAEQKKGLINHDFLILEIRPGKWDESAFYIKAEKLAEWDSGDERAGIHLSYLERMEGETILLSIKCETRIGLDDLIAILKKKDPDYDTGDNNCWDYAKDTGKWLLEACVQAARGVKRRRLEDDLLQFEANILKTHAVNTGRKLWNRARAGPRWLKETEALVEVLEAYLHAC